MKKHIKYPKIAQLRNVIHHINRESTFVGLDDNGDAIYNPSLKRPILRFKGTVKLHGTNAGVSFNAEEGIWPQSRKSILSLEHDNAGFAFFVESHKAEFQTIINEIITKNSIDSNIFTITVYGEWAGIGIQDGVGISQVEKAFYVFGVKVSKLEDEDFASYWIDSSDIRNIDSRIFNVEDFETYSVEVDFNMPQLAQNKFLEITEQVEKECPTAKALGIIGGMGEGVVWTTKYNGNIHRFKVKGEKHSVTKVKTLAKVDVEKLNSIQEFVEYAVTENRFEQAIENIFGTEDLDIKKMGDLIRWVVKDILSEELDTMVGNNLVPKDVNKYISFKTREMMFVRLNEQSGL